MLFTSLSSGVAVPRVVGLSEAKAKAAVRASGLRAVTQRAYIDGVGAGVVARQRPANGEIDKEATVDLWVSPGPLHVAAPALRGLTSAQAHRSLADAGLLGDARKTRSAIVAAGHVAHQEPEAGGTLTRGQTVKYWVSAGLPLVEVPDVVDQDPAAGTKLGHGAEVTIEVAVFYVGPRAPRLPPSSGRRPPRGPTNLDAAAAAVPSWSVTRRGTGRSSPQAGGASVGKPRSAR